VAKQPCLHNLYQCRGALVKRSAAQVRDTLGALAERFAALRPGGAPGLALSRLGARQARPLLLKRVVQYSPAWVKSQNRMASTSNQVIFFLNFPPILDRCLYFSRGACGARPHSPCMCPAVDAACVWKRLGQSRPRPPLV